VSAAGTTACPIRSSSRLAADTLPLLFSYGSLQRTDVQQSAFGRVFDGARDEVVGWQIVPPSPRGSPHANAIRSEASHIAGTAFVVTDAELAAADAYERRDDYVRVMVRLASGREGWMYVDAQTVDS
jgi:gamma-glutamylcyclotransferase (GGCT)/AIG2-like uncharacterized protein YtfP